ncbi:MAG: hypothetical protein ACE369_09330 [Roseovarius sp.]
MSSPATTVKSPLKSVIIGLVLASMVGVMALGQDVPGHPNGPGFEGLPVPGVAYLYWHEQTFLLCENLFYLSNGCLSFFR